MGQCIALHAVREALVTSFPVSTVPDKHLNHMAQLCKVCNICHINEKKQFLFRWGKNKNENESPGAVLTVGMRWEIMMLDGTTKKTEQ